MWIGMARGLSYMHEEIKPNNFNPGKPVIVHRDFKSTNVLLKSNLEPVIADFGLSVILYSNQHIFDLEQVGTPCYMAPEVLEGAVNFLTDSLKRVDIYACSLVFWEIITRWKDESNNLEVNSYKLPYEEEVGLKPTLEDIQKIVCQQKKRPQISPACRSALSQIVDTIEECWDQDADARPSASCIVERLNSLKNDKMAQN